MGDENEIFMKELKEKFKQTVSKNLIDFPSLIKENKFKEIAVIAHDLKGTSGIFGLDEGAEIAKQLQESAQNEDMETIKDLIEKLAVYMKENDIIVDI